MRHPTAKGDDDWLTALVVGVVKMVIDQADSGASASRRWARMIDYCSLAVA